MSVRNIAAILIIAIAIQVVAEFFKANFRAPVADHPGATATALRVLRGGYG